MALSQASTVPHREVSPDPPVSKEEGEPRREMSHQTSTVDDSEGLPTLTKHSGIAGEAVGFNHWKYDCDKEEGGGVQQTAARSWPIEFTPIVPKW